MILEGDDVVLVLCCECLKCCLERQVLQSCLRLLQRLLEKYEDLRMSNGWMLVMELLLILMESNCSIGLEASLSDCLLSIVVLCPTLRVVECLDRLIGNSSDQLLWRRIHSSDTRKMLSSSLFRLGVEGQQRRFRSLVRDVCKVCGCEQTEDSLLGYAE